MITLIPTTIAPMEKEWATMASKYRYRINADKALKDELVKFIQTTIYLCETQDLIDNNLWTIFQKQFKGFTVESFKKIYIDIRFKLQRHLLKRGVYIGRYNSRVTISKLLFKAL